MVGKKVTFQRIILGLLILTIAGLAGSFYINWKMATQLQSVKAFVEGSVLAEAVAACEKAPSTTPFKWNTGTKTSVIGLSSVKLDKYTIIPSYTLVADSVYCDYDPIKKKADIGSNFLERD
jgi:hypothetical protein